MKVKDFELTIPLELDVEDYVLNRASGRQEPMRKGTPAPTGKMSWVYDGPTYYDAFRAGTIFSLAAEWSGDGSTDPIEDTTYPSLDIGIAALAFTGDDPEASPDDRVMQDLPFEVLDNETDPTVTLDLVTSDTSY